MVSTKSIRPSLMQLVQRISPGIDKISKVFRFAIKEFRADRCDLRASALTLFSLLSIVPIMAMAFGVAKGFGFKAFLERRVLEIFAGQEKIIQQILSFSDNLLEKTQGGVMAVLGILLLFYSLIKLIGHIESAFNKIWWVSDGRPLIRKFTDYTAIAITSGILVLLSSSANIFITAYLGPFLTHISLPINMEKLISFGVNVLPFFSIWILFFFFYTFIPNKRPHIGAVAFGAVVAGTIYQAAQMAYLKFQVGVSSYNAIYGSFAALPLFLFWLQASWNIFLFGAEICFAWENTEALETQDITYEKLSIRLKKLIILRIVHLCVKRFAGGSGATSDVDISHDLKIPLKIIKALLNQLVSCHILLETAGNTGLSYVPAKDIEKLSTMDVLDAFEMGGDDVISVGGTIEFEALEESLDEFEKACRCSPGMRILKDI